MTVFFSMLAGAVALWGILEAHVYLVVRRGAHAERAAHEGMIRARWQRAIDDLAAKSTPRDEVD